MKIKMISLAKGPDRSMFPEHEYDVPEAMAQQLIAGGYAVAIEVRQELIVPTSPIEWETTEPNPVEVKKAIAAKKKPASAKSKKSNKPAVK
jgi:hypothetical protein